MSLALAQLLPEFHLPGRTQSTPDAPKAGSPVSEPDPHHIEAAREQGLQQGRDEMRRELLSSHASEIEELQARHQAELEEIANTLSTQVAQAVPNALAARQETIVELLEKRLAATLAPVIGDAVRNRMISTLCDEVRAALEIGKAQKIVISGPEVWLEAMRETLACDPSIVEYRQAETADVDIAIDETHLSSRFAELEKQLREAVA